MTARDVATLHEMGDAPSPVSRTNGVHWSPASGAALGIAIVDLRVSRRFPHRRRRSRRALVFRRAPRRAGRRVNRSRSRLAARSFGDAQRRRVGVRQDTDHGSSTSTWAHFTAFHATDEYLFLMTCPESRDHRCRCRGRSGPPRSPAGFATSLKPVVAGSSTRVSDRRNPGEEARRVGPSLSGRLRPKQPEPDQRSSDSLDG